MDGELDRIRAEYTRRDRAGSATLYQYTNPAFAFHMLERDWAILDTLHQLSIGIGEASVLEVGCGTGHALQRFRDFGAPFAVGVDLMENRIRRGKADYPNLRLLIGDGAHLPLASSSFTIVLQLTCLSSVLDMDTRRRIASEIWRILKPGGIFISFDMRPLPLTSRFVLSLHDALARAKRRLTVETKRGRARQPDPTLQTPIHPIGKREIEELFPHAEVRCRPLSLDFRFARFSRRHLLLTLLLARLPFLKTHYYAVILKPRQPPKNEGHGRRSI